MCVGEVPHLRVLVSIISDFLHMRHSMFGSHMRARTGCAALMYEAALTCAHLTCICGHERPPASCGGGTGQRTTGVACNHWSNPRSRIKRGT